MCQSRLDANYCILIFSQRSKFASISYKSTVTSIDRFCDVIKHLFSRKPSGHRQSCLCNWIGKKRVESERLKWQGVIAMAFNYIYDTGWPSTRIDLSFGLELHVLFTSYILRVTLVGIIVFHRWWVTNRTASIELQQLLERCVLSSEIRWRQAR